MRCMDMLRSFMRMLRGLMVTVLVALAMLLAGVRVVGLTPYAVLSGSMEPAYTVGSLIYVRPVDAQEIRVGTPLTFRVSGGSVVATHRVHEVVTVEGERRYITKGDANELPDPPVSYANVIGTPVFSIPWLGYLSAWLRSGAGWMACACAALLLLGRLFREIYPAKPPFPSRRANKPSS